MAPRMCWHPANVKGWAWDPSWPKPRNDWHCLGFSLRKITGHVRLVCPTLIRSHQHRVKSPHLWPPLPARKWTCANLFLRLLVFIRTCISISQYLPIHTPLSSQLIHTLVHQQWLTSIFQLGYMVFSLKDSSNESHAWWQQKRPQSNPSYRWTFPWKSVHKSNVWII